MKEEQEFPVTRLRLRPIQHIAAAPNKSLSAVDWIPDFAGYAWLAYAAGPAVVITVTACPPLSDKEAKAGSFFEQVLHPVKVNGNDNHGDNDIRALAWSPVDGALAVASTSRNLYVYEPHSSGSDSTVPELPLVWRQASSRENISLVHAITWTQSGNGLLAAGPEVVMFAKLSDGWKAIWKSKPEQPHFLASATFTVEGFAATAAKDSLSTVSLSPSILRTSKGMVSVWYWDDQLGLEEEKLPHPHPVSSIQWRQSKESGLQRQILLTSSLDGAVRLWIQIDSSGTSHEKKPETYVSNGLKKNFFVGAVIEANQCLGGILGQNISVMWAYQACFGSIYNYSKSRSTCTEASERNKSANCEWLVGVAPSGTLALWSLHCLDDSSPFRCPRVHLWKKGINLQLHSSEYKSMENFRGNFCSGLVKAFVHRIGGKLTAPPSSVDLFLFLPNNVFNWVRAWLPLTSAGSNSRYDENTCSEINSMKSSWSVTSRTLDKTSYSGKILNVCCHPITEVEIAASVDSNGLVLLWSLSSCIESNMNTLNFQQHAWARAGGLQNCKNICQSRYSFLAWAPLVVKEQYLLLFAGHAQGFDCVFLKKCITDMGVKFEHEVACTVQLPVSTCNSSLGYLNASLLESIQFEEYTKYSIMVIGSEHGKIVEAWNVGVIAEQRFSLPNKNVSPKKCSEDVQLENTGYPIRVEACLPVIININTDEINYFYLLPSRNIPSTSQQPSDLTVISSLRSTAYDFVTTHNDGILKFWEIKSQLSAYSSKQIDANCVGVLKVSEFPVHAFSLATGGTKFATVSSAAGCENTILSIWDAESYLVCGTFALEDRISLPNSIRALSWIAVGNAQFLLAVAMQYEVLVYSQRRLPREVPTEEVETNEFHLWHCIACYNSAFDIQDVSWGPQGKLVVVCSQLLCIIGQWVYFPLDETQTHYLHDSSMYPFEPKSFHFNLGNFISKQTSGALSLSKSVSSSLNDGDSGGHSTLLFRLRKNLYGTLQDGYACSLFEIADSIGGPVPAYHPNVVLHYLLLGNVGRALACIRHLAECLNAEILKARNEKDSRVFDSLLSIPPMPISHFLISEDSTNRGKELQWGFGLDNQVYLATMQKQPGLPKDDYGGHKWRVSNSIDESEIQRFIKILEQCPFVPCLTDTQRIQLLALLTILLDMSHPYKDLDEPAKRFWLLWRSQKSQFQQTNRRVPLFEELEVESKAIAWAFHSDCQDNLLDLCLSDNPSWSELKSLAVGFWFMNVDSLRQRIEKVARIQYLKNRDPKHCALLYMALNRKSVLMGLFKVSRDEKDKAIANFLARDFQEETHKAAALKNAYVLKGKHQFELAVSFFLLGGDPGSAVSVCARDLKDVQLALVICHLVEGTNGPLSKELISKYILPTTEAKKDYWLASLLQWQLGNIIQSIWTVTQPFSPSIPTDRHHQLKESSLDMFSNLHASCLDFDTSHYLRMLIMKPSFRKQTGDIKTSMLATWATVKASRALKRGGLLVECLDYLSSFTSFNSMERLHKHLKGTSIDGSFEEHEPSFFMNRKSNWISKCKSMKLDSDFKLGISVQLLSRFVSPHTFSTQLCGKPINERCREQHEILEKCLLVLEHKYSVQASSVLLLFSNFAYHYGWLSLWPQLATVTVDHDLSQTKKYTLRPFGIFPAAALLLQNSAEEICYLLAHVVNFCGYSRFILNQPLLFSSRVKYNISASNELCRSRLFDALEELKVLAYFVITKSLHSEKQRFLKILSMLNVIWHMAFFWLKRDARRLLGLVQYVNNFEGALQYFDTPGWDDQVYFHLETCQENAIVDNGENFCSDREEINGKGKFIIHLISENKWRLVGFCLWNKLALFAKTYMQDSSYTTERCIDLEDTSLDGCELDLKHLEDTILSCINCTKTYLNTQLTSFVRKISDDHAKHPFFHWLQTENFDLRNNDMDIYTMNNSMEHECNSVSSLPCSDKRACDIKGCEHLEKLFQVLVSHNQVSSFLKSKGLTTSSESSVAVVGTEKIPKYLNDYAIGASKKKEYGNGVRSFDKPETALHSGGELFEALCVNSCNPAEAVVASNRKGLLYFNLASEKPLYELRDYLWSDVDWPKDGWAGSRSTPMPTFVSPGVGLGNKGGSRLGLGATVGPGMFGVPGYAGIGAMSLGWSDWEDLEGFVDPPATNENISTRALASHPLRPLFLVGSSNTHVYLWEFGKAVATGTYGVLPAANVPPPYALASVSAVQFDSFGQRFASAALDGTVCAWQLEVGGRANIQPTESSSCFQQRASDIAFFGASASVLAATGLSANSLNLVIWDTLAPPTTSRISVSCHEGGARSLAVFDNQIGSASITPLVVSGGISGDVGIHDIRYTATGKSFGMHGISQTELPSSEHKVGKQNPKGMSWYIPKAHEGSVTKVSVIPGTNLFLTGSKDGDVKLWDVKKFELVYHWTKVHDKHTFIQPHSRRFGGVVQAAVTDIQILPCGFLTCGGDGTVKLFKHVHKLVGNVP